MEAMQHFMAGFFLVFSFFKLLNLKGFAESYIMYDVVIGIDPGYKGALAIYDLHTDSLVDLQDCPVFVVEEVKANKKKKKVTKYKKFQMYQQLLPALHFTRPAGTPHRVLVALERVHAMPKQGTCSMFTFVS